MLAWPRLMLLTIAGALLLPAQDAREIVREVHKRSQASSQYNAPLQDGQFTLQALRRD